LAHWGLLRHGKKEKGDFNGWGVRERMEFVWHKTRATCRIL